MVTYFVAPNEFQTRPTLQGSFGMVATSHWLPTACAQSILERGGNAFDAAVAAAFVHHIAEPQLNGPGGDMTALIHPVEEEDPKVVCGQGPAPRGASVNYYRALGLDRVPGAGALAAAVPGAVDAWLLMLRDYGTWELSSVLEYAINYGYEGIPISAHTCEVIGTVSDLFKTHWRTSEKQWMPNGEVPSPGQVIRFTAYANTLQQLVSVGSVEPSRRERIEAARREWREGFVADSILSFIEKPHRHSDGKDHAGILDRADFENFSAHYETPLKGAFRGLDIAKTGVWGQGPVLIQALSILETFEDSELDPSTVIGAHHIIEALKLALADRDAYYGDYGLEHGPCPERLKPLFTREYAQARRSLISDKASYEFRPGYLNGVEPYIPPFTAASSTSSFNGRGEPTVLAAGETDGDTCHLDVVDQWGNIVSATPSGGWLQSSPYIPDVGISLGTRLQMTWLDKNSPSALRGAYRPRTTLSPTMVLNGGKPVTALGTPGGDQQDQWQLLYLLRTIVGGYSPQQAIDAPAFHTLTYVGSFWPRTWAPGIVAVEDRIGSEFIKGLEAKGHKVQKVGAWSLGRLSVVNQDWETGAKSAAANPRAGHGYAAGR